MSEISPVVFLRKEPTYHPDRENLVLSVEEARKKLKKDGLELSVSKNDWKIIDSKSFVTQIYRGRIGDNKTIIFSMNREIFYCVGVYDPTNNKHLQNMVNLVTYRVGTADNSTLKAESVLDG